MTPPNEVVITGQMLAVYTAGIVVCLLAEVYRSYRYRDMFSPAVMLSLLWPILLPLAGPFLLVRHVALKHRERAETLKAVTERFTR